MKSWKIKAVILGVGSFGTLVGLSTSILAIPILSTIAGMIPEAAISFLMLILLGIALVL